MDVDHERWRRRACTLGIVLVAFALRFRTAGNFQTIDELTWMRRSLNFSEALSTFDLGAASASQGDTATMPGVPTMWLGSFGRWAWQLGDTLGLWSTDGETFARSERALRLSQLAMALACALLIGVVVLLARRWAGPTAAYTTGLLLATEPFLVAHGSLLHTDELTALFGIAGALALFLFLGVGANEGAREPDARQRRWLAIAAAVLLVCALLTKLSALTFAPGLLLVVVYALWRRARRGEGIRELAQPLGIGFAVAFVTALVLWPALIVDAAGQFELLEKSADLASGGHQTYFRGSITQSPGAEYFAIAMPLRMTPWFLVALPLATIAALASERSRERALCALAVAVPIFIVLSGADSKFDRYGIVLLPWLALIVGVGLDAVVGWVRSRAENATRALSAGAIIAVTVMVVYSFTVAPWGLGYFNPLLGGGEHGQKTLLVGWGEGLERFGRVIEQRQDGDCDDVVVATQWLLDVSIPCGKLVWYTAEEAPDADYVIEYIALRQRLLPPLSTAYDELLAARHEIYRLEVRGIDYGAVYALR